MLRYNVSYLGLKNIADAALGFSVTRSKVHGVLHTQPQMAPRNAKLTNGHRRRNSEIPCADLLLTTTLVLFTCMDSICASEELPILSQLDIRHHEHLVQYTAQFNRYILQKANVHYRSQSSKVCLKLVPLKVRGFFVHVQHFVQLEDAVRWVIFFAISEMSMKLLEKIVQSTSCRFKGAKFNVFSVPTKTFASDLIRLLK